MVKHKTNSSRNKRQKLKRKLVLTREEAQLQGVTETVPEGAPVKSREIVPPSTQGEQLIPSIDRQAIRKGWAVPEDKKQLVIDRLLEPFEDSASEDPHLLKENAKVLILGDQRQWERDNPEESGKSKGASNVVLDTTGFWQGVMEALAQARGRPSPEERIEEVRSIENKSLEQP